MLKSILRVSLAVAILCIVMLLGARTTTASPSEPAIDDDSQAEPMSCSEKFCETECPKLHHCTGFCGPHGGCVCVGAPGCNL